MATAKVRRDSQEEGEAAIAAMIAGLQVKLGRFNKG